jgi:gamma-glutamyltranspeptidase/glutathione hydrolase
MGTDPIFLVISRAAVAALFVFGIRCEAQTAKRFMVAAAHPLAAEAGAEVLRRGGSAVDAAIAVQMMLGLVEPESSGIGGGAFMLHWSDSEKRLRTYDGRETAPATAKPDRFLDSQKRPLSLLDAAVGGLSVGVPGVLRMLELAHQRHGRLPWAELFDAAIRVADEGFTLSPKLHAALEHERFLRHEVFYDQEGKPRRVGTRIVNREYAETLRVIARGGARMLYEGDIAKAMVLAVRTHAKPGDLTEDDLRGYRAVEREAVCGPYREWRVCSMAPPSSGGIAVLQILGLLERTSFARAPPQSAAALHLFAEAGKLAYADRARYLGDPQFVAVPIKALLNPGYLEKRARLIGKRAMPLGLPGDSEAGTSHFSIVDARGDIVAMTTTIEAAFGSRIMVRGFLLNNQLTDFDFAPGGPNSVAGGKRPRSSMAPTLVFEGADRVRMALGSPGGAMIINYVAKALVGALDWRLDIQAAIELPNFGSRNGPTLIEQGSRYETLVPALAGRGHQVEKIPLMSGLQGIERVPGGWRGGADPRREGAARGQ